MSWDIFVLDLPRDAQRIEDVPDDFKPGPIGKRSEIIRKIQEVIPTADFSDPCWGVIDIDDWSIEVSMGKEEECNDFAHLVRGGAGAVGAVAAILEKLNLRGSDPGSETGFFVADKESVESFKRWAEYRDSIIHPKAE